MITAQDVDREDQLVEAITAAVIAGTLRVVRLNYEVRLGGVVQARAELEWRVPEQVPAGPLVF